MLQTVPFPLPPNIIILYVYLRSSSALGRRFVPRKQGYGETGRNANKSSRLVELM